MSELIFGRGSGRPNLWELVDERVARAEQRGFLSSIETAQEVIEDHGVGFVVHVLAKLVAKRRERRSQERAGINPFLPHDPELLVADLSATHHCLLNKFNVLQRHILILTKDFEDQEGLLTRADMEALAICMAQGECLGWYNAGVVAGASQPHRHLQLIAAPLGPGPEPTPIDGVIGRAQLVGRRIDALGLRHVLERLDLDWRADPVELGRALHETYQSLLIDQELDGLTNGKTRPYNLLITRGWMMLAPRRLEHFGTISLNALAFAGSLLVRDQVELETVRRHGPLNVLRAVSFEP